MKQFLLTLFVSWTLHGTTHAVENIEYGAGMYGNDNKGNAQDRPEAEREVMPYEPDFIGCYKDARTRAMEFSGGNRKSLMDCKNICETNGYRYYGRQGKNECFCTNNGSETDGFKRYGEATDCHCEDNAPNHGYWHNCVYDIGHTAKPLGCFADNLDRALPMYMGRGVGMTSCMTRCQNIGCKHFGRQSWGECWCGRETYDMNGEAERCKCDRRNIGAWKQCVYEVQDYMGCFLDDKSNRALPHYVGSNLSRERCYDKCHSLGYHFMGRQSKFECWCGGYDESDHSFKMHGRSDECKCNNMYNIGGWKNCVYRIFHE